MGIEDPALSMVRLEYEEGVGCRVVWQMQGEVWRATRRYPLIGDALAEAEERGCPTRLVSSSFAGAFPVRRDS